MSLLLVETIALLACEGDRSGGGGDGDIDVDVDSDSDADSDTDTGTSTGIPCTDTDEDKDGASLCTDCDDSNPSVHPGATDEWGNDVDEDCDGVDGIDGDGDGYAGGGGPDCDDDDPAIHPGAVWFVERAFDGHAPKLQIDAAGMLHVLYDFGGLRHARKAESGWESELVLAGDLGERSFRVDGDGFGHVAHLTLGEISYATNRGGAWLAEDVVPLEEEVAPLLAVDAAAEPHLVYADTDPEAGSTEIVHVARAGGTWTPDVVAFGGIIDAPYVWFALDGAGDGHVAWVQGGALVHATDESGGWVAGTIEEELGEWGWAALGAGADGDMRIFYVKRWAEVGPGTDDVEWFQSYRQGTWIADAWDIEDVGFADDDYEPVEATFDRDGALHLWLFLDSPLRRMGYASDATGWAAEPVLDGADECDECVRISGGVDGAGVPNFVADDGKNHTMHGWRGDGPDGVDRDCDGVD